MAEIAKDVVKKEPSKEKDIVFTIDEQMGIEGNDDVFVGVNGKTYLIARGHEVVAPESVVVALEQAIYTKYKYNDKGEPTEYKIPRFSVRRIREATSKDKIKNRAKVVR